MESKRPNLILITTDQQRFDALGRADNGSIFTPHLNWLVDQGIHFRRCYSDCPMCMPARATIMTGKHGYRQGLTENSTDVVPQAEHSTLPGLLTGAGYQTRAVGKMHFHPTRAHYGFEHMDLPYDYVRQSKREGGPQPWGHGLGQNEMEPVLSSVDESRSLTRWIVDKSIDFIETRDPTRPFFMWTSFTKPHPPFDCDAKYWALYDRIEMPARATGNWSSQAEDLPDGLRGPTHKLNGVDEFSDAQLAASRRAYYACISQVDYNLGLLFARLREMDLLSNTWIVFTSDHGEMLGDHWLGGKGVFLEPSAHVPLIVRPPAGDWQAHELQNTQCDSLACLADILPTLLNRAGVALPDRIDGIDLVAMAGQKVGRERLFGACENFFAVIEDQIKYQLAASDGSELMFAYQDDPLERCDLIRSGEYEKDRHRLRLILDVEMREYFGSLNERACKTTTRVPAHRWPGFHSVGVEVDVLH